jgi:site-specific DNA-methyltransferase (adenine-specific)
MSIYYSDATVTLHHGDMRDILPTLPSVDAIITDPPFGETALPWDSWPHGWPALAARHTNCLWYFGSLRMFTTHWPEFTDWRLAQDIIWEKPNGSGWTTDRFKRVHEQVVHLYRGNWSELRHETPRLPRTGPPKAWRASGAPQAERGSHRGAIGPPPVTPTTAPAWPAPW